MMRELFFATVVFLSACSRSSDMEEIKRYQFVVARCADVVDMCVQERARNMEQREVYAASLSACSSDVDRLQSQLNKKQKRASGK